MLRWMMERLTERVAAIVATSFSSTVETMHALGQAEQQGQLEEAARRYEAQGMTEVAESLRERSAKLTTDDPAAQALTIAENLAAGGQHFQRPTIGAQESEGQEPAKLEAPKSRRRKKPARTEEPPFSAQS